MESQRLNQVSSSLAVLLIGTPDVVAESVRAQVFLGKRVYSLENTFFQQQDTGFLAIHIMLQIGSSMDTKIWHVSRL